MKTKNLLWLCAAAFAMTFTSCEEKSTTETVLVTFEDVALDENGIWNGSDLSGDSVSEESWGSVITNYYGSFQSENCTFPNVYTQEWASWKGAACSNHVDSTTVGYANQYSVYAATGAAGSEQFGVMFDQNATIEVANVESMPVTIKSIALTNSTYVYRTLAYAENGGKVFVDGDYFKVTITGKNGETTTGAVDYFLADYRAGKTFINKAWETVDISSLGEVTELVFTFDGTDKGDYGLNTPAYVAIDNIVFKYTVEE